MRFHLFPKLLQRFAKKLFYLAAAETDDVGVFPFHPGLVEVAVSTNVQKVQLVDESSFFQHLQGAVNGHAIQLRIPLFSKMKQTLSIEVLSGLVD
jgi:hypothetical protein